ncbi:polysaccharide biosynthesis/export family protein, partial [Chromobacterium haemolyticum]|uniref:polysaccharide biosynthesis/export family protein n=1 Tax=Chromobacterium haemolyticum TaxID=394935 RepID=UPI0005848B3A
MQRAKLIPLLCLVLGQAHAVSLRTGTPAEPEPPSRQQPAERAAPAVSQEIPFVVPPQAPGRMFGSQLFGGAFRNSAGQGFNPNYQLSIGDRIALRLWGAFNFDAQLLVDPQGNIFIPNIGPVPVAGIRNGELNAAVSNQVRRVYKANVNVYAALDIAQPVKVFVTGFVKQPGL